MIKRAKGELKLVKGGASRHKPVPLKSVARKRKAELAALGDGPTPVRAQLAQRLRTFITDGTFRPGDRMTERELCERLRVSRPSVREALRQLEAEGLIDILPNRGPVVRMITAADVLELWEVRVALETLIARRFAIHGTEAQIEDLEEAIRDFDAALKSQDVSVIKSSKTVLWETFAAGANSSMLAAYFRQVNARLSFLWSSSLMFPGRPAESISEFFSLLAAIRSRNADASQAAIVLHNEHARAIAMYGLRVFEESRRKTEKTAAASGVQDR